MRIKIRHMEIAIIRRETTGSGPNVFNENETIAKYEIMDGSPVRGESIPIRVFLAGYDLTPTMRDINKKFSVRYYLNLVLVDEEERRYFKQQVRINWDLLSSTIGSHLASTSGDHVMAQRRSYAQVNSSASGRGTHSHGGQRRRQQPSSSLRKGCDAYVWGWRVSSIV